MISPNFDARPAAPDMIVLHYTEIGEAAARAWLCNPASKVSSHYLLREDGGVECLVPEAQRAWHAGVSGWEGRGNINVRSIGIEIVNAGHGPAPTPYPTRQIEALIALVADIRARHGIARRHVVGHSDVAPGRKIDPGEAFPWKTLADAGHALWVPPAEVMGGFDALAFTQAATRCGYWTSPIDGATPTPAALVDAVHRRHCPLHVGYPADAATIATLEAFAAAVEADAAVSAAL